MNYQKWKFPIALEIKKNKKEFNLEVKEIYIYLWGKLSLDIQHLLHGTSWIYLSTN